MWLLLTKGCPEYCKYEDAFELADRITGYDMPVSFLLELEDILLALPLGVVRILHGERVIRVEWPLADLLAG